MSNLEKLKKDYEQLGETIKRMEGEKTKAEWPKLNDSYWFVRSDTSALPPLYKSTWNDDHIDRNRKSVGNIFRTREEAEREYETRKTIAELRSQPGRKKFSAGAKNYSVQWDFPHREVNVKYWQTTDAGFASTYFESKTDAEAAIKAVGAERILAASKWLAMGE